MKESIVRKLWLTLVGVILVILLVLGVVLSQLYQDFYYNEQSNQLLRYGQIISEVVLGKGDISEEELNTIGKFISARAMVVDKQGLVLACNGGMMGMRRGMKLDFEEAQKVLKGETVVKVAFNENFGQTMLLVAEPIEVNNEIAGAVFLFKPVTSIEQNISEIRKILVLAALIAVIIATILAFFLSKTLSQPLIFMHHAAHAMAKGNFDARLAVQSKDEIGLLALSLNNLAEQLKHTLHDLHAEKDKMANVLSSMSDGVLTFSKDKSLLMHNNAADQLLPYLNELLISEKWPKAFDNTIKLQNVNIFDWHSGDKDYHVTLAPLADDGGVVAVLHEVTNEKRLDRLRRDFVANVTHELRTPLSLMQGYAEAMVDFGDDEAKRIKYAQVIMDETKRLNTMVTDLLELSKVEKETIKLQKQVLNIEGFLRQIIDEYEPVCKKKNLNICLNVAPSLTVANFDPAKMKQVIINLLDNACRYGADGGKIIINASQNADDLHVSVTDFGKGIPAEDLEQIWERFYRVDKSRQRTTGGTGLGLAIVKNIILAHGGDVKVESTPYKETTFTVSIPLC